MSDKVKKLLVSAFAFGASKGAVFLVPLILSNLLVVADYGLFESSLAYASVLAVVLSAGASAAIPYFMLANKTERYNGFIYLHALVLVLLLFPLYWAYVYYQLSVLFCLSFTFAVIIAGQRAFSADMKARSSPGWASFSDSFLYILILLLIAVMAGPVSLDKLFRLSLLVAVPVAIFVLAMATVRYGLDGSLRHGLGAVYQYALPTILPVITLLIITSLVRLVAPWILPHDELAIYAFYFRFASISVIAFQFLATIYFSVMYKSDPERLDRAFLYVSLLVLALSVVGFFAFPAMLSGYFKLFASYAEYWGLYLVLIFFCFFWVGEAMLEPIIYREKLASAFLLVQVAAFSVIAGIGVIFYVFLGFKARVIDVAYLHTVLMATIFFMQMYLLRSRGIALPYFFTASFAVAALLVVLYPVLKVLE